MCFRRHRTHVYSSFNDYGGQMSQHLNCECWSLITVDTYHGWMLADKHSGISRDGVNDYQPTNALKLVKKKVANPTLTGYSFNHKIKDSESLSVLYQKMSFV